MKLLFVKIYRGYALALSFVELYLYEQVRNEQFESFNKRKNCYLDNRNNVHPTVQRVSLAGVNIKTILYIMRTVISPAVSKYVY